MRFIWVMILLFFHHPGRGSVAGGSQMGRGWIVGGSRVGRRVVGGGGLVVVVVV